LLGEKGRKGGEGDFGEGAARSMGGRLHHSSLRDEAGVWGGEGSTSTAKSARRKQCRCSMNGQLKKGDRRRVGERARRKRKQPPEKDNCISCRNGPIWIRGEVGALFGVKRTVARGQSGKEIHRHASGPEKGKGRMRPLAGRGKICRLREREGGRGDPLIAEGKINLYSSEKGPGGSRRKKGEDAAFCRKKNQLRAAQKRARPLSLLSATSKRERDRRGPPTEKRKKGRRLTSREKESQLPNLERRVSFLLS